MAKETFNRLNHNKKQKIINGFLREFSINTYDEASISSVVKSLGIAKGSIYQYFENKLDLYIFLVKKCSTVKQKYIGHIKRKDFSDFWIYFRTLYEEGVKFDIENPLESNFLHNMVKNINSPSVKNIYDNLLDQIIEAFSKMIRYEINNNYFRNDLPVKTMAFFLYKTSLSINDHMQKYNSLNPEESIIKGKSIYDSKKKHLLLKTVDDYILLLKNSLTK